MRSADITGHRDTDPTVHLTGHPPAASAWSDADLVALTLRFATDPTSVRAPTAADPLTTRVRAWSVPLLITPEVEAWLLGWPAGLVTAAHGHGRAAMAVTVVEGGLSEECLDPTIWTTSRRTTWRAGVSTLFPAGHVHVLGATGDRPAVAVHAWSRVARSGGGGAGRPAPGAAAAVAGRGLGGGRGRAEPVRVGPGRGRHHCLAGQAAHGTVDLGHVRDRVAG